MHILKPYHWAVFKGMASSYANGFSNLSRRARWGVVLQLVKLHFA